MNTGSLPAINVIWSCPGLFIDRFQRHCKCGHVAALCLHTEKQNHPSLNLHRIIMQEAELAFPKSGAGQSLLKSFPGDPA